MKQRDRQTETGRQADGLTDRQGGRQAGRQAGRQTDRHTDTERGRQADRQIARQRQRHKETETQRQGERQTERKAKQAGLALVRSFAADDCKQCVKQTATGSPLFKTPTCESGVGTL